MHTWARFIALFDISWFTAFTRCLLALMGLPEARARLSKAGERVFTFMTALCSSVAAFDIDCAVA